MTRSITDTLARATAGDSHSLDTLVPLVYAELRALAAKYLQGERSHTLQPTALVHEAFLKMVGNDDGWSGKDHFKAVAARAMRQVLVDHARARNTIKRGGNGGRADFSVDLLAGDAADLGHTREMQVEELDQLLTGLAQVSSRLANIAEMRLFGGMESEQMARVTGQSVKTIQRDWKLARAWLAGKIKERNSG